MLREKLNEALKDAMRAKDATALSTIRLVLARLKEQPGRDITVGASGTLVRFLLRERLLDELQLFVHPVIADSGARLFEGYGESLPLTLAHCHAHGNGVVALRYTLAA